MSIVEGLEEVTRVLREWDQRKYDAIAIFSDQLLTINGDAEGVLKPYVYYWTHP